MANVQIPNLPVAIALSGTEEIEVVQSGTSRRATTQQIADLYVQTTITAAGANTEVQFNDGGFLNGNADFTFNKTTNQIAIAAGSAAAPTLIPTGDTNTGLFFPAADTIAFAEGGAEAMRINSSGNVGIGTPAPTTLLSVNGISSFGAGAAATPSIAAFGDLNTGMWFPAADTVAWSTNGTERLRIASGGTVSTTGTLTIAGGAASISSTSFDFVSSATFSPQIVLVNTANDAFGPFWNTRKLRGAAAANSGDQLGTFVFQSVDTGGALRNSATFSAISEGAGATFHSSYFSYLVTSTTGTSVIPLAVRSQGLFVVDGTALLPSFTFANDPDTGFWRPANNTLAASTNAAERLRIDSSGNVGIGTTAPDALLSVNGVASFGDGTAAAPSITNLGDLNTGIFFPAADSISLSTNGVERFAIISTGEIRIPGNTQLTNAGNNLIYTTTAASTIELRCNNAQQATASFILLNGRGPNDNILFNTNAIERMRISAAGNLGLGTSTFGTSAATVLAIATGTAPTTGPADTIQIYSTDLTAGNTMLSLYTEGTIVNANTTAAATHRIAIRVNGTVYYLLANTSAA